MNYIVIRYIIFIILILSFILYIKLGKRIVKEKSNIYVKTYKIVLIYLFIWIILNNIPFENYFIKFKTIDDNINYFFTNPKIKKKFVYDDYAYVYVIYKEGVIKEEEINCFMPLENKNGSWEFSNLSTRNQGHFKTIDNIRFQVIEIKDKNSMAIEITSFPSTKFYEIKDSLNSKIYTLETSKDQFKKSFIIINKRINKKDYKIFINDKEYKPLE